MRLLIVLLTTSFMGLSLSGCTSSEIDSFCVLYTKVIVQKGDGSIIASSGVKKRLLANEVFYRQNCGVK